ncbi:MAG: aminomethyl-transferring glycine dehydrogenase subunit GcvPB [Anaerolineae bacterium]|nr:aminomethyl-transferring glycine dehydrogenase subunit GcvPB [Anaerolineae bacterium]
MKSQIFPEPLIFEISRPGRCAVALPELDVPPADLPRDLLRDDLALPEVGEVDLIRHYTHLSQMNYGVDTGFYPLGSCTMKYNPKINEEMARLPGFVHLHPYQDEETVQGALALMYFLQEFLKEIGGFAAVSLQPAAGAHGELTGVLIMRAWQCDRGQSHRDIILVPDSAHGTNPATTTMSGLKVVEIPSDDRGNVDLKALEAACREHSDRLVGMMLTNPNTLGLFDEHLEEITALIHEHGGLMYGDGANMNALLGIARPGELGFDVLHYNLHKTFSTPHGGGGPGSGPVGVSAALADFLPSPIVVVDPQRSTENSPFFTFYNPPKSIGRVKAFYGHFGIMVRAYTYIRMMGPEGLRQVAKDAVLNANYLKSRIQHVYHVPYNRTCMHEFVCEGRLPDAPDVRALDISKRLIDYGFHPPTNYFPLIVPEALMIEPTETESKDTLDAFADALLRIAEEARTNPQLLHEAPHNAPVRRLDEVRAAKELILRWEGFK